MKEIRVKVVRAWCYTGRVRNINTVKSIQPFYSVRCPKGTRRCISWHFIRFPEKLSLDLRFSCENNRKIRHVRRVGFLLRAICWFCGIKIKTNNWLRQRPCYYTSCHGYWILFQIPTSVMLLLTLVRMAGVVKTSSDRLPVHVWLDTTETLVKLVGWSFTKSVLILLEKKPFNS